MKITRFEKEMKSMTVKKWIKIVHALDDNKPKIIDKYNAFCNKKCKYNKNPKDCFLKDCEKREIEYWNELVDDCEVAV